MVVRLLSGAMNMTTKKTDVTWKATVEKPSIVLMIKSIEQRGRKLTDDIRVCAVSCVLLAVKHKDVTMADQLLASLPESVRKDSLRFWFTIWGPMRIEGEGDKQKFKLCGPDKYKRLKDEYDADAKAFTESLSGRPIWDAKTTEAKSKAFDFGKELAHLIKKAEKIEADKIAGAKLDGFKEYKELFGKSFKVDKKAKSVEWTGFAPVIRPVGEGQAMAIQPPAEPIQAQAIN